MSESKWQWAKRAAVRCLLAAAGGVAVSSCSSTSSRTVATAGGAASASATRSGRTAAAPEVVISVKDQKLALLEQGRPVAVYPVSTSKFCLGDTPGSFGTPLGHLRIAQKIGDGAAPGTVFKHRRPTGEVLPPNAPGRDPIVTRILRLRGEEDGNSSTWTRHIYIHGTPEEATIGRPASYGCVRMRSGDVIDLFNRVPPGTSVNITKGRLPGPARTLARRQPVPAEAPRHTPQVVPVTKPPMPAPKPQLASRGKFGPPVP